MHGVHGVGSSNLPVPTIRIKDLGQSSDWPFSCPRFLPLHLPLQVYGLTLPLVKPSETLTFALAVVDAFLLPSGHFSRNPSDCARPNVDRCGKAAILCATQDGAARPASCIDHLGQPQEFFHFAHIAHFSLSVDFSILIRSTWRGSLLSCT